MLSFAQMEITTYYLFAKIVFTEIENELRITNIAERKLINNQYDILLADLNIQANDNSKQFQAFDSSFNYYLDRSFPNIPESYKFRIITVSKTHITIDDFGQIPTVEIPLETPKSELVELIKAKVIQEVETIKVGQIGEFYFESDDQKLRFAKIADLLTHLQLQD
jgi:hypothetical protein